MFSAAARHRVTCATKSDPKRLSFSDTVETRYNMVVRVQSKNRHFDNGNFNKKKYAVKGKKHVCLRLFFYYTSTVYSTTAVSKYSTPKTRFVWIRRWEVDLHLKIECCAREQTADCLNLKETFLNVFRNE